MIVRPLPGRPSPAILGALLSHGWEGALAAETAGGLEPWGYQLLSLSPDELEALLRTAPRFGLELLTGADWAILAGTRSRLSAMARSWTLPPALHPLMEPIGRGLPADPPDAWLVAGGPVALGGTPVFLGTDVPAARFVEVVLGRDPVAPAGEGVRREGLGLLLTASGSRDPGDQLAEALEEAARLGVPAGAVALDPGWQPGGPDLALSRAFGCPLVCTTEAPVTAALAWERGARLFRATAEAPLREALALARRLEA